MVDWHIIGQTMMLTTVIIACVPTLYHIFAGLHSGLTTTQIPDGVGVELPKIKASGYINQTSSSGGSWSQSGSRGRPKKNGRSLFDPRAVDTAIITEVSSFQDPNQNADDRQSSSSEGTESTRHLTQEGKGGGVLRTVDITVEVEEHSHRDRL
jgi:hypothetical protein